MEFPKIERELNLTAVDQLLNFPGVVAPTTFFKDIFALEAGHMLICKAGQRPKNIEYWDLRYTKCNDDLGEEYYVEELKKLLLDAIRIRLIADVPIGFYISGGLDSSIVAGYIDRYISHDHSSFSAEVLSQKHNESEYQKIISTSIKSKHYSVQIHNRDLWEKMSEVVYYTESGLRESYDVAAYLLSELVGKTDVKAVLTGQGSDEFFNGYTGYLADFTRMMTRKNMSKEECEINERLWGDSYFRYERNHAEILQENLKIYSKSLRANYDTFSVLTTSPIDLSKVEGLPLQRRRSYIDAKLRLADHLLGDHGDRMFFAHSIEGRHPFLDRNLIDFVVTIPEKYKLKGANEKYILKKAAEGIVPEKIINRRKFPFSAPGMSYMLKEYPRLAEDYLSKDIIRKYDIFDYERIDELVSMYRSVCSIIKIP